MELYGLKTCDTCRKALKSLGAAGWEVTFVDVRATPVPAEQLAEWSARFDGRLLNNRSTTWRGLSEAERAAPVVDLLVQHPALMKRPVIVEGDRATLGWDKVAQSVWL